MFNLFRNPCPIGAKILFQTNSAKDSDDEVSQGFIVARLSTCSGYIVDQELVGFRHIRNHDLAGFGGKIRKFAHGVHGKAPLLSPTPVTNLQKALDVVPTQRPLRQGSACRQHVKILAQACDKQVLFVLELCIQAGFAHSRGLLKVLNTRLGKAMLPKDGDRFVEDIFSGEQFSSSHCNIIAQFPAEACQ